MPGLGPGMKIWIAREEIWPVYVLYTDDPPDGSVAVEISEGEMGHLASWADDMAWYQDYLAQLWEGMV